MKLITAADLGASKEQLTSEDNAQSPEIPKYAKGHLNSNDEKMKNMFINLQNVMEFKNQKKEALDKIRHSIPSWPEMKKITDECDRLHKMVEDGRAQVTNVKLLNTLITPFKILRLENIFFMEFVNILWYLLVYSFVLKCFLRRYRRR